MCRAKHQNITQTLLHLQSTIPFIDYQPHFANQDQLHSSGNTPKPDIHHHPSTNPPNMPTPLAPLLRLPLELRYAVYDDLCPSTPHSYPYTQPSPIAAIDTTGPPLNLLLSCQALYNELSAYYFNRCTFRFVAQSFSAAKRLRENLPVGTLHVIRCMKKVELLLLPGTMRAAVSSADVHSIAVRGMSESWLAEQMGLLGDEAGALEVVVVSMRRVSWNSEWSMKEEMEALLKPLGVLQGRVQFRVGEVMGPAGVEEEMREELRVVLGSLDDAM